MEHHQTVIRLALNIEFEILQPQGTVNVDYGGKASAQ